MHGQARCGLHYATGWPPCREYHTTLLLPSVIFSDAEQGTFRILRVLHCRRSERGNTRKEQHILAPLLQVSSIRGAHMSCGIGATFSSAGFAGHLSGGRKVKLPACLLQKTGFVRSLFRIPLAAGRNMRERSGKGMCFFCYRSPVSFSQRSTRDADREASLP